MTNPIYPSTWYYVVGDNNPLTQVYEVASGGFVANNTANYVSWVANGGSAFRRSNGLQIQVLGAINNGSGAVRLTVDNASSMTTNDVWVVQNVGGVPGANGTFAITVISLLGGVIDLQGSTFSGAYTSGGVIDRGEFVATKVALYQTLNNVALQALPTQAGSITKTSVTSGADITLTNPLATETLITNSSSSAINVKLPAMNMPNSIPIGLPFFVTNSAASSGSIILQYQDGSTQVANTDGNPGTTNALVLTDNSFLNGFVQWIGSFPAGGFAGVGHGDSNATISAPIPKNLRGCVALFLNAALTAPRTWTLPAASAVTPGGLVFVSDMFSGISATNTLTVARAGADTINGGTSVVLNRGYDWVCLMSDGNALWTIVGGKSSLTAADLTGLGTGVATALGANTNASGGFPTVPVALSALANIANNTVLGNNSGGSGPPLALTLAQTIAMLPGPKVGLFTRDVSTASGTQAITGVGFKPRALIFFAGISEVTPIQISWGFDDGTAAASWAWDAPGAGGTANSIFASSSRSLELLQTAANFYFGTISSMDTDGFTVNWTKIGTPTGTATIYYMAIP